MLRASSVVLSVFSVPLIFSVALWLCGERVLKPGKEKDSQLTSAPM
jgi:hypothetical protein